MLYYFAADWIVTKLQSNHIMIFISIYVYNFNNDDNEMNVVLFRRRLDCNEVAIQSFMIFLFIYVYNFNNDDN